VLEVRLAASDAGAAAVGVAAAVAKPAMEVGLGRIVALQHLLIVALSLCNTAHPRHTRFANIFGTSLSEATMRPNLRWRSARPSARAGSATRGVSWDVGTCHY
jgi:hypothetical protein